MDDSGRRMPSKSLLGGITLGYITYKLIYCMLSPGKRLSTSDTRCNRAEWTTQQDSISVGM